MAKVQPKAKTKVASKPYQHWPIIWRIMMLIYAIPLVITDVYYTVQTATGYNTYDSCGNVRPSRPGVALVIFLLFIPVIASIVCAVRWPPRRWWTIIIWIIALAALGAAALLFALLSNLDICLTF